MGKKNDSAVVVPAGDVESDLAVISADPEVADDVEDDLAAISADLEVVGAQVDAEAQVEASVESFESAFAGDPLAQVYKAFAEEALATVDPESLAPRIVTVGAMAQNIQYDEQKLRPAAYKREVVMKKIETALRIVGVSPSLGKEALACFWVVKLDQSIAGGEGEARSFQPEISPEWFGGNLRNSTLRDLATMIHRANGKDEVDIWEYDAHMESYSRQLVKRLRNNELSLRQLRALIDHKRTTMAKEAEEAARKLMSATQLKALDEKQVADKKEALRSTLRNKASDMVDYAIKEVGKDKAEIAEFLVNMGAIPVPPRVVDVKAIAAVITPGEIRGLVQSLLEMYVSKPDRLPVLKALLRECKEAVKVVTQIEQGINASEPEQRKAG